MVTIGCAGFPVPATRYFKEFLFVEVQDTHVTQPGAGTIRRWRREAPPGFTFALLAPREIGQENFRDGKVTENALKNLVSIGKELEADTAVFASSPDFALSRANKTAVKDFLAGVKKKFKHIIFEAPPDWDPDETLALAKDAGVTAGRDPLLHGPSPAAIGYYRLAGPAGHKSRYEDPAIEKLAQIALSSKNEEATYVFTNVDMFADAKRLKRAMGL